MKRSFPTVDGAAGDIVAMRVRGAAEIARHAVSALGGLAEKRADRGTLETAARKLVATRPTAVSLRNGIEYVMGALDKGPDAVFARAERFIHDSLNARERVARRTASLVPDARVILTHCNSQAAVLALQMRHLLTPFERVLVLETRPWRQGLLTARQLAESGVPVRYLVDAAMGTAVREAQAVVTGADTIARNGDVVNKIGTALLALAAQDAGVPFYVSAESFKLDPRSPTGLDVVIEERDAAEVLEAAIPGVEVGNPVFDVTPAERVTRIVLETGAVAPAEAIAAFEKFWGTFAGAPRRKEV